MTADELATIQRECRQAHHQESRDMWSRIGKIENTIANLRVELARESTKVALIVGGLSIAGGAIVQFILKGISK